MTFTRHRQIVALATALAGACTSSFPPDDISRDALTLADGDAPLDDASRADADPSRVGSLPDIAPLPADATALVRGEVRRVEALPEGPRGVPGIHTLVELASDDAVGRARPGLVGLWVPGGELGDRRRVVSHQPRLAVGDQVALALRPADAETYWIAGGERGAFRVAAGGRLSPLGRALVGAAAPTWADLRRAVGARWRR